MIKFPTSIDDKQISVLKELLPDGKQYKKEEINNETEIHELKKFEKSHINANKKQTYGEAYDEDDGEEDGYGSGKQVRCATQ